MLFYSLLENFGVFNTHETKKCWHQQLNHWAQNPQPYDTSNFLVEVRNKIIPY